MTRSPRPRPDLAVLARPPHAALAAPRHDRVTPVRSGRAGQHEVVALNGGEHVFIRPLRPDDRDRLARGYRELSEDSAYRRFFTLFPSLSRRQLDYFTEIDHDDHEALAAEDTATEEGIGVARYVRDRADPASAEIALTILDAWQGRGVGVALLERLADRARAVAISRFTADTQATNPALAALLAHLGPVTVVRGDDPTVLTMSVALDP
jgi:RimJ/RimL family protein N-acetyltransferase